MSFRIISCLAMSLLLLNCSPQKKSSSVGTDNQKDEFTPVFSLQPGVIIYKTRGDYRNLVPVLLSEDKSKIIAYPHPGDLRIDGRWLKPELLEGGYLLDNKGIQLNMAFLTFTYEEYSNLENVPPLEILYKKIEDKNPFIEFCDCGNKQQYEDIKGQINKWIQQKRLRQICKTIL